MLIKCGLLQGCCHGARFTATPFSCCPRARHISISTGQQSATRKRSASAQEVFLSTICCREIEARHCWPVENLQVHHPRHQQTKFSQCVPHAHDRTVVTDTSHMSNDCHRLCAPRKSITSAGTNVRGVVSKMPRLMCRLLGTVLSLERMCGMLPLPLLISRQKHIKSFTSFFFLFRGLPQDDALNSHLPFQLAPVTVWASNFVMKKTTRNQAVPTFLSSC